MDRNDVSHHDIVAQRWMPPGLNQRIKVSIRIV